MNDSSETLAQAEGEIDPREAAGLRFLRRLVTVLTLVMILGFLVLVAAFVTRFPTTSGTATSTPLSLPEHIALPDGITAETFTHGGDWIAIVASDVIYVFDAQSGTLRQSVEIK